MIAIRQLAAFLLSEEMQMIAIVRSSKISSNTGEKLAEILALLRDPSVERVTFFATPVAPDAGYGDADGAEANLPEMVALLEGKFAGMVENVIVLDGAFLTAARVPRYREVRELLDEAQENKKVFFSKERAPFTSRLPATEAATVLSKLGPVKPLTAASRAEYFSMLSNLSETEIAKL
jgi:hypothetical protein